MVSLHKLVVSGWTRSIRRIVLPGANSDVHRGKAPLPLCVGAVAAGVWTGALSKAIDPKVLSMRLRALRGRFCFNGVKVCRLKEVVCGREQLIAFQELAGKVD